MMKVVSVVVAIVAVVTAAPQSKDGAPVILKSHFDNNGLGPYRFGFETSNGISAEEEGQFLNPGTDNEVKIVRGSYSYVDAAGGPSITVTYTADKDGFHAEGAHLPV